jgi:hypothetical protein
MRLALLLGGGTLLAGLAPAQESAAPSTPAGAMESTLAPADTTAAGGTDALPPPLSVTAVPDSEVRIQEALSDVNLSHAMERVGFSGIIYTRGFNQHYFDMPEFLWPDAARTSMDANFTLKVGVNASSFLKAWSMVSFGYDFAGHFQNDKSTTHINPVNLGDLSGGATVLDTLTSDYSRAPYLQDKNRESARIFEDLSAGVDIRTEPVDANLRAGSAMWVEGSPFTIWKRDPRPKLAWYYETYEPEQSSYQYYTQKFFYRRNDLGRLSWPKKAFGGIEADAFRMPGDFGLQVDFMQPANMLPSKTDGNTYNAPGDAEALGSINSMGQLYFARLTKQKVFGGLIVGANMLWVQLPEDIINQTIYSTTSTASQGFRYQFYGSQTPFYTQPRVFSLDTRGNLGPKYFIQADVALAYEDSVIYHLPDSLANDTTKTYTGFNYNGNFPRTYASSGLNPAGYVKLNSSGTLPMETELFYAAKSFWSPYAMTEYAVPVHRDEMKLGSGSFSYQPNLMGASWKVSPKMSTGFLSFTVGEHVQPEEGKDILRFQQNLNGREVWNGSSSWSRTEPGRLIDEGVPYYNPRYVARLGEGQRNNNVLFLQSQPGGLRGDDQELWEEFAAYDNVEQANSGIVPQNKKISTTLAVDWGYDIAPLVGYSRNIMIAAYGAVNSIAKDLTGPANSDQTLLWSGLARLETVLSVSPTFQLIGQLGLENWKSDKAYVNVLANKQNTTAGMPGYFPLVNAAGDTLKGADGKAIIYNNRLAYESILSIARSAQNANPYVIAVPSPIDYLQTAAGVGFDWDFAPRAGLHVRYKYATHSDKNIPENDWNGSFFFAESKLWF